MIQKTFPESTSQTQTQTWTIPHLKSISNVKVNSGSVAYSISGDTITFTLKNGAVSRTVQTGGSAPHSTYKTDSRTVTGDSAGGCSGAYANALAGLPSSIYYSDGTYSGTLSRTSTSNGGCTKMTNSWFAEVTGTYGGTVSSADTRTYASYYQYTVTIDYVANSVPVIEVLSPVDNQTLTENSTLSVAGSALDQDVDNAVTIKYRINGGTIRNIASGVSDGSTPLSFARDLKYTSKRMYDGAVDVAEADLAENTDHTLTVWAEDDKGGKSAEVTRKFRVVWNRPPTISGQNSDLGTLTERPTVTYSAVDPEGNSFTFTEYVNGQQIRSFAGAGGQQNTFELTHDAWIKLDLDVQHQLKIVATDSAGISAERVYTFTRTETHLEFMLDYNNPDVAAFFTVDGMPERILFTLERYLPPDSEIESVLVTNNYLDASPTWEDARNAVIGGRGYIFTNKTKTAADWGICVWVTLAKGSATQRVHVYGYGGAFD